MSKTGIESLDDLTELLQQLPGVGPRSAERIAFYLLRVSKDDALRLAGAIRALKEQVRHCSVCFNLTQADPCRICQDARRDHAQIIVVEQPKDILQLEQTGMVRGVYHVLMGHISPLDGVQPGDLTIDALVHRVKKEEVREVVMATSPTVAGDGTALHVQSLLSQTGVSVKRLARGLPTGTQLEYANPAMLSDAIEGMREM
jgi:recombination protein RecR